jgi:hypothetical protein
MCKKRGVLIALTYCFCWLVGFMVFNAILNNISVGVSFIGGGNRSAR